jgi:hypothetical protein
MRGARAPNEPPTEPLKIIYKRNPSELYYDKRLEKDYLKNL